MDKNLILGQNSTVESMSVADVRKALSMLRKEWADHTAIEPICPSKLLTKTMSMSEFSFRFVMGHHHKRHMKTKLCNFK